MEFRSEMEATPGLTGSQVYPLLSPESGLQGEIPTLPGCGS